MRHFTYYDITANFFCSCYASNSCNSRPFDIFFVRFSFFFWHLLSNQLKSLIAEQWNNSTRRNEIECDTKMHRRFDRMLDECAINVALQQMTCFFTLDYFAINKLPIVMATNRRAHSNRPRHTNITLHISSCWSGLACVCVPREKMCYTKLNNTSVASVISMLRHLLLFGWLFVSILRTYEMCERSVVKQTDFLFTSLSAESNSYL